MKNHTISAANYLKAIKLGYYELIECISVFQKKVTYYKVCGRTEELLITIKN